MKIAFDEGLIITEEQLRLDVGGTRKNVESAFAAAFALSLGVAYPTEDNMVGLLQIAHREAYSLSVNAAAPTKETIEDLIRKAHMEMLSLSSRVPNVEEKATQAEKAEKS
jgi:large subunit ribosomal protein L10